MLNVPEGAGSREKNSVMALANPGAPREIAESILREGHPLSLSATFDSGNNLVSPVGVLARMPVGNALARVRKLPGVARNREAPDTSFVKNECIKISISCGW